MTPEDHAGGIEVARQRVWLGAGAIATLITAAPLAPQLLRGTLVEGTKDASRSMVLTLRSESSSAPCLDYWEQGSAPDGQHAWIGLHSTADGGRTWRHLTAAVDPNGHQEALSDDTLSWFITARRGWIDLPRDESIVWTTADGAGTLRPLPGWSLDHMGFADDRQGIAFLMRAYHQVEPMRTADGGESWHDCGVYHDTFFDSVFLLDPRRGWALVAAPASHWDGPSAAVESEGPMRFGVMRTEDGGCHWRGQWNVKQRIDLGGDLYFLNEREGWITGGYLGGLYHTADGGSSWRTLLRPSERTEAKGAYFRDADRGWLITEHEELFETRDAGRAWRGVARKEVLARLDELMSAWDRWRIGKLYGMLLRGSCFPAEHPRRRIER